MIPFDNTYARLPDRFFARQAAAPVPAPRLLKLNRPLALQLGLDPDALASPEGVEILAGNRVAEASDPIALVYAGHQFGNFVPQLGDGRALLLGEVVDKSGARRDIQLKGSGPTPFSRRGDGRAAMGPVLREYIVSEAMAALGIPTTRSLAAVATGEPVYRETVLPGAVLTRVASSHIRVGTFQFFAARRDSEGLRLLADHVIDRHYPEARKADNPYLELFRQVMARQAALVARWQGVGFIHGVMNTDNVSVAGETIDYGPCAFMDTYHPATAFSSIDHGKRYAYGNQPDIAGWNMARFGETLLPLLSKNDEPALALANEALSTFPARFAEALLGTFRRKLGLFTAGNDDTALAQELLTAMAENQADFTLTFRRLCDAAASVETDKALRDLFTDRSAYDDWAKRWRARLAQEPQHAEARPAAMKAANPAFIPRNHLVEAALAAAVSDDDLAPFEKLIAVLARPYEDQPGAAAYADPPSVEQSQNFRTFCGT